ncbi:MAG: triose-phosphate isomerase, partial [Bacteroidota bacterium]
MRQLIAAGNWKMNLTYQEGLDLVKAVRDGERAKDVQVIFGTPAIHLAAASALLSKTEHLAVAAQNCHEKEKGAYTGNISVAMVKSAGAKYVILGHSERRAYHSETDALIAQKVDLALAQDLQVIYCCGEQLPIRELCFGNARGAR